jgi:hypothetical protein
MKKLFFLFIAIVTVTIVSGQNQKSQITQKVKENLSWLAGTAVDNLVTVNISQSLWTAVLDDNKNPQGQDQFYRLGSAIIDCHDYLYDTKKAERCDPYNYPTDAAKTDCEKEIIADKNKLNIAINAANIKFTEISYRLLFGYTGTVTEYLRNGSGTYGFSHGWRPKTKELHIIVELSDKVKDISVAWSTDGKTATISGPAYTEVNDWNTKINKGLERGGSYKK